MSSAVRELTSTEVMTSSSSTEVAPESHKEGRIKSQNTWVHIHEFEMEVKNSIHDYKSQIG